MGKKKINNLQISENESGQNIIKDLKEIVGFVLFEYFGKSLAEFQEIEPDKELEVVLTLLPASMQEFKNIKSVHYDLEKKRLIITEGKEALIIKSCENFKDVELSKKYLFSKN